MRKLIICSVVAALAALTFSSLGSANTGVTCLDQDSVRVELTNYKAGKAYAASWNLTTQTTTKTGTLKFTGPTTSFDVDGVSGGGTVVVLAYGRSYPATFDACPAPPPPPGPPSVTVTGDNPPPPPAQVTPPTKIKPATDCPTLKANKAGKKWLVKFGCKVDTRVTIDCSYLLEIGAGPKWYWKIGEYYKCVTPIKPRPPVPYNPPVTG